jgi:transcriptional regulator
MYIPRHFDNDNRDELLEFIDATAVATLVTAGPAGLMANQVPLLRQPEAGRLWGHLARPNSQLEELAEVDEVLLVFNGPHGYVSPNWYTDTELVPTWNFSTVQVRGRVTVYDNNQVVRDIVRRLTDKHEAGFSTPWSMDKMDPERLEKMLSVIVGFHVEMEEVRGKFKLSQNRDETDRNGVITGLETAGNTELAAMMRRREDGNGPFTAG